MEICSQLTGSHRRVGAYAAIMFSPAVAKRSVERQRILGNCALTACGKLGALGLANSHGIGPGVDAINDGRVSRVFRCRISQRVLARRS
jgi:hypothetical protein